ncbi:hypothetical protein WZ342_2078 [Enterococcus faecalis]|nr:hypothetical protein WZ342_2078 [Enterococcus faecalis]
MSFFLHSLTFSAFYYYMGKSRKTCSVPFPINQCNCLLRTVATVSEQIFPYVRQVLF